MSNLYWLSEAQMERLKPFLPRSHGKPRVDDRRVLSGMIFINRNGLRWCDAPREYGPAKTLYNRWKRWSENGVFARIMMGLAAERAEHKTIMIDATCLKAHRTASSLPLPTYGPPRCKRRLGDSVISLHKRTACRRQSRCQDGDPRVPILIKGPVSETIFDRRLSRRRSTVRPSSSHHSQLVVSVRGLGRVFRQPAANGTGS